LTSGAKPDSSDVTPEAYAVSRDTAERVIQQLTIAEKHLKQGASLLRDGLKQYEKARKKLRLAQSRIGTGK
jgi:hypothetical protein